MALRTGSLGRELAQQEPDVLQMILEDYKLSKRREKSSRVDFASGWLAAARRLRIVLTESRPKDVLPW